MTGTRQHPPLLDRLARRSEQIGECWVWLGSVNSKGYGLIARGGDGSIGLCHRLAFEALCAPIPDSLTLDHLCRVKRCWCPDHLDPVPMLVNRARHFALKPPHRASTSIDPFGQVVAA